MGGNLSAATPCSGLLQVVLQASATAVQVASLHQRRWSQCGTLYVSAAFPDAVVHSEDIHAHVAKRSPHQSLSLTLSAMLLRQNSPSTFACVPRGTCFESNRSQCVLTSAVIRQMCTRARVQPQLQSAAAATVCPSSGAVPETVSAHAGAATYLDAFHLNVRAARARRCKAAGMCTRLECRAL
jgi:hypothetical protein